MSTDRSLAARFPHVAALWHPTRNHPLTPHDVLPASDRRVWWQCPAGHEWDGVVGKRVNRSACPFCSGRRVTPETSLAALHAELATQWHPTANEPLRPVDARPGSPRRVWWRCDNGHDWEATIANRVSRHSGCPECFRMRRVGVPLTSDPLSATHPQVAEQWHPTANNNLTPDDVTYGSGRRVWWRCDNDHDWEATVNSRAISTSGCPVCMHRVASPEYNLAVVAPDLAAEWHPTRNDPGRPTEVTPATAQLVWWQCHAGHEWQCSPHARRYRTEANCPTCGTSSAT